MLDVQAWIARNRLKISYFSNSATIFVLDGPSNKILSGEVIIFSGTQQGIFTGKYVASHEFLRICEVINPCEMQKGLGGTFFFKRFDKKGNRKPIENDEHRFL